MTTLRVGSWKSGGVCSNINKILAYLYKNKHREFSSLQWNVKAGNYGPLAYLHNNAELFGFLFKQDKIDKEVEIFDNPGDDNNDISWIYAKDFYGNIQLQQEYSNIYHKYFEPRGYLMWYFEKVYEHEFRKDNNYVSILVRSDVLGPEQPRLKMPSFEEYAQYRNQFPGATYLLSVDNEVDLKRFKEVFKPHIVNERIRRSPDRTTEPHTSNIGDIYDLYDAMCEVYMLSKAQTIIHPVSNMATTSLIINPSQHSEFLGANK